MTGDTNMNPTTKSTPTSTTTDPVYDSEIPNESILKTGSLEISVEISITVLLVVGIIVIATLICILLRIKRKKRDLKDIIRGIASI